MHQCHYQARDSEGKFAPMGRTVRVSVRLTPSEYSKLKRCADRRGWSMTQFIAQSAIHNARNDKREDEEKIVREMFGSQLMQ